jgi:hypothetical protein
MSTPALLTVLDGDDPEGRRDPSRAWTPWGEPAANLRKLAAQVRTPDLPERARFEFYFELLLHDPDTLRERDNWSAVVGTIVDLTNPQPDVDFHAWMCYRIAAAPSPLVAQVGYHLGFVVVGRPSLAQDRLMDRFEADADRALSSKAAHIDAGLEIASVNTFPGVLRTFERRMRQFARSAR